MMSRISIQEGNTLDRLQEMCSQFTTFYAPLGVYDSIDRKVKQFVADNVPPVTIPTSTDEDSNKPGNDQNSSTSNDDPTTANEPTTTVERRQIKRHLTQRSDVQAIIDELTSLLPKIDEGSSIDLSFVD